MIGPWQMNDRQRAIWSLRLVPKMIMRKSEQCLSYSALNKTDQLVMMESLLKEAGAKGELSAALAIPLDRHVRTLYAKAGKRGPIMVRAFYPQAKPGK
nr:hypothetical protein [uncultured Cohaesibacter sp.]